MSVFLNIVSLFWFLIAAAQWLDGHDYEFSLIIAMLVAIYAAVVEIGEDK